LAGQVKVEPSEFEQVSVKLAAPQTPLPVVPPVPLDPIVPVAPTEAATVLVEATPVVPEPPTLAAAEWVPDAAVELTLWVLPLPLLAPELEARPVLPVPEAATPSVPKALPDEDEDVPAVEPLQAAVRSSKERARFRTASAKGRRFYLGARRNREPHCTLNV
jgi:hypothetical protein